VSQFKHIDISAMALSVICMVHCLTVPMIATLAPLWVSGDAGDAWAHWVMLLVALPLSAIGLWQGYQRHLRVLVPALGATGLALMAWDLLPSAEPLAHDHNLTLPGVLLVAGAHVLNIRGVRRHAEAHS
jgi:hypothetical protein